MYKFIRYLVITIALTLCIGLSVSAADNTVYYNGAHLPEFHANSSDETYHVLFRDADGKYTFATSVDSFGYKPQDASVFKVNGLTYDLTTGVWKSNIANHLTMTVYYSQVVWTNKDLMNKDGSLFMAAQTIKRACDGSSCPANDADANKVCDDCGMPFTFTMRTDVVEFAEYLVGTRVSEGYNYYAIFEHTSADAIVFISKSPMYSEDRVTLLGTDMQYNMIYANDTGGYGGTGWYNGFYEHGITFVKSNHSISNFPPALPMAEKILAVAEEQMTTKTLPEVSGTMTILTLCGVGLMALLVVLSLFGKRSLISLKR